MAASDESSSCVKCKKAIKSKEIVLVCGLWCGKSFHNECLGLSNSEARVVMCSKVRIKFHCETCEKRLGTELFRGKEANEPKRLENCVNSCVILELVQNLVKLTNEVSNSNSAINTKLDTVLSSNARLEEYLLQPPKCFENRSEETRDSSLEDVEIDSTKRVTEIREQNNDTSSQNQRINSEQIECCVSELQQSDDNNSLCIASEVPRQLTGSQQQNVEESSSNYLQEWEVPDGHNHTQDPLGVIKEEFSPSEDFLVSSTFCSEKTEVDEEEEMSVIENDGERHSSSEDFLGPNVFNIEKTEDEEVVEAVSEVNFQELKHEVELTDGGGEPESTIHVGADDVKSNADNSGLVTSISLAAGTSNFIQCTTKQEAASDEQFSTRHLGHGCGINVKRFAQLQELKKQTLVDRHGLLHLCSMCNKEFASRGSLTRHFKVHTGERPYSCSTCNKTFKQSSELKVHTRVHTGELPYMCEICSKRFSRITNLKQHIRQHTWKPLHSCNICHKNFRRVRELQRHQCVHVTKHPST